MTDIDKFLNANSYKISGAIKPRVFTKQSSNLISFTSQLGQTTDKKGSIVYTTFKAYAYPPTFDHPFTIKISLNNPSGSAFVEMPVHEFVQLLTDLNSWYESNKSIIDEALSLNQELLKRRELFYTAKSQLQDTTTDINESFESLRQIFLSSDVDIYNSTFNTIINLIDDIFSYKNSYDQLELKSLEVKRLSLSLPDHHKQKIIEHLRTYISDPDFSINDL